MSLQGTQEGALGLTQQRTSGMGMLCIFATELEDKRRSEWPEPKRSLHVGFALATRASTPEPTYSPRKRRSIRVGVAQDNSFT